MIVDIGFQFVGGSPLNHKFNSSLSLGCIPDPIVRRANAAYVRALNEPDVKERFLRDKTVLVGSTPGQFRQLIVNETERWRKLVAEHGIKPE